MGDEFPRAKEFLHQVLCKANHLKKSREAAARGRSELQKL